MSQPSRHSAQDALRDVEVNIFEARAILAELESLLHCKTCNYWEKGDYDGRTDVGQCLNGRAMERVSTWSTGPITGHNFTRDDFGCLFWERRP